MKGKSEYVSLAVVKLKAYRTTLQIFVEDTKQELRTISKDGMYKIQATQVTVYCQEYVYEYITKMNIDEDKFICPFRTTTSKTGSVTTSNSDHNSIVVDLRIKKDSTRPKRGS